MAQDTASTSRYSVQVAAGLDYQPGQVVVFNGIDKAVIAYERKKEKRCEASPGEISAKRDLKEQLAKYRDHLPKNEDGERFYRLDGVDYILTETLKRHRADDGEVREENL